MTRSLHASALTLRHTRRHLRTRFTRKLHLAFATMLLITLTLAWYFFDSVTWYEQDLRRLTVANQILNGYQSMSNQTLRLLNLMGDRVNQGRIIEPQVDSNIIGALRAGVTDVQLGIAEELTLTQDSTVSAKLDRLRELERIAEEIIRSYQQVTLDLHENRVPEAVDESNRLKSSGVPVLYFQLLASVLREQQKAVEQAHRDALGLARYATDVLPLFVVSLTVFTVLLIWFFSRSITRSINEIQKGAEAFRDDNFSYRIPELSEAEFNRLGRAFNVMAGELQERRKDLHDINTGLEAAVTERTRALKETNQKLAEIDDNRRKWLADLSHEFRTPLTVIQGESEIALRGTRKSSGDYRDSLLRIMNQAMQTTRLVDDLLFIARADSGEPRITLQATDLAELLRETTTDFMATAKQKHITLRLDCPKEPAMLSIDSGRIRQVITILLDNALRYTPEKGKVEVALIRSVDELVVQVQDTGIGLTPEDIGQIFERFYRGNKAADQQEGTGLGLPVAKAIVEAHRGRISLTKRAEGGTCATVALPLTDAEEEPS